MKKTKMSMLTLATVAHEANRTIEAAEAQVEAEDAEVSKDKSLHSRCGAGLKATLCPS